MDSDNNNNNKFLTKDNPLTTLIQLDDSSRMMSNGENVTKNLDSNQFEIEYKGDLDYYKVVSDLILDPDTNYIFKIQVKQTNEDERFSLALVYEYGKKQEDQSLQQYSGSIDCSLRYKNNEFIITNNYSFRQIKGDHFKLTLENELELRVNLNQEIFQILDYPLYNYHAEKNICQEFFKEKNQRLYIGIDKNNSMKVILKDVSIVEKFD